MFQKTFKEHPVIASPWPQTVDDWPWKAPVQQLPFSPFLLKLFLGDIKERVCVCLA